MSPTATPRRRYLTARIAHVTGDAAWGVFVVARLMAEMSSYGLPRRYADYSSGSLFTTVAADTISACVIGALAVVIIAAVVEAIAIGRWPAGMGTIAAPVLGAAVILTALYERAGHPFGGLQLNLVIVFVLVLVGVACRQVWSQAFAPRRSSVN